MGFSRNFLWLIIGLIPFFLFSGCGDLEPEMQDTRTVVLKMDFNQRSSSRSSQVSAADIAAYQTHLILALPSLESIFPWTASSSYQNHYHNSLAKELMIPPAEPMPKSGQVTMEIPLNTKNMRIAAFLFKQDYDMPQLKEVVRVVGYFGESQPFSIGTNTNSLSLGIPLQCAGPSTCDFGGDDFGGEDFDGEDFDGDDFGGDDFDGEDFDGDDFGGGNQGGTDSTAPTVSFSPANGANGVAISGNITITFSEAVRKIDNNMLTDSDIESLITLKLNDASGSNINFDATINTDKKVITINPTSNLFYSQAVYLAIGATLEDYADNPITAANATFTTGMDPSLEAYYPFNGNANDESGNSYHGQLGDNVTTSKFPTKTTDRYGNADKAFSFDGNDYIALNKYVTYNSISEITVCTWVLSADTSNNKFIISFDRSESFRLALNDDVNSNPYVGWDTTDSNEITTNDLGSPGSYEDGNWHHICGWYKSSPTEVDKKIFVDGAKVAPLSSSNAHSGRNLGTDDRTKHYGFIGWGSEASSFDGNGNVHGDDFMIGKIDDVRIYSRALSDDEISALYLRERP